MWWIWILIGIGAAFALLIAVVLVRTMLFRPKRSKTFTRAETVGAAGATLNEAQEEKAINDLAEMIRCKTVSSRIAAEENKAEFDRFQKLLKKQFPLVHKTCELTRMGERGLLYAWHGTAGADAKKIVLMSHYDVVAADEQSWTHPPFGGERDGGFLWGRGTLDTKQSLNGVMQSAEILIAGGFEPKNDVYFAFAGDEEIGVGTGAKEIVSFFDAAGIKPDLVLDEGGAITENFFPGVKEPFALIGTAEKGMMDVKFSLKSKGGHASSPPAHTIVGKLAAACCRIEGNPFKARVPLPVQQMLDNVARHSGFGMRLIFANLWLFKPLLFALTKRTGGELNAMLRTTVAFTQMSGSKATNVLAPEASMVANMRLITGDTVSGALERIRKIAAKKGGAEIDVSPIFADEPSPISRTSPTAFGWQRVCGAISITYPGVKITPYLMFACSDSRHYGKISDNVYRFSAIKMPTELRKTVHGHDERIPETAICDAVRFYINLMKTL